MRVLTLSSGKAARVENTLEELAAISVRYRLMKRLEGLFCAALTAAPVAVRAVVSPSRRPPAPLDMLIAEVVAGDDSDDNCD